MLSIASAQETMGDRDAARKTLEELIAKYPGSSSRDERQAAPRRLLQALNLKEALHQSAHLVP